MKYGEIVSELALCGSTDPNSEAAIILESLFGVKRATIMAERQREYEGLELVDFLEKRRLHIPLQHILGEWEFMGKSFFVSADCLIPRPDTEILVEKALEIIKNRTQGGDFNAKCKMQNAKLTPHPPQAVPLLPLEKALRRAEIMQNAKFKIQNAKWTIPPSATQTPPFTKEALHKMQN